MSPVLMPIPMSSGGIPSAAHWLVQARQLFRHRQRRPDGMVGVIRILQRERRSSAMIMSPTNLSIVPSCSQTRWAPWQRSPMIELRDNRFGLAALGDGSEAADVGEQHGHVAAIAAESRVLRVVHELRGRHPSRRSARRDASRDASRGLPPRTDRRPPAEGRRSRPQPAGPTIGRPTSFGRRAIVSPAISAAATSAGGDRAGPGADEHRGPSPTISAAAAYAIAALTPGEGRRQEAMSDRMLSIDLRVNALSLTSSGRTGTPLRS